MRNPCTDMWLTWKGKNYYINEKDEEYEIKKD